jgi:hypothetical protein
MVVHDRGPYVPQCRAMSAHSLGDKRMSLRADRKSWVTGLKETLESRDAAAGEPVQSIANLPPGGPTHSPDPDDPSCQVSADHDATAPAAAIHGAAFTDEAKSANTSWLTRDGAASYLRAAGYPISEQRLAKLAVTGDGPEYRRWGSRVLYDPILLMKWAKDRESTPSRPAHQPRT